MLDVGAAAPEFELKNQHGETVTDGDFVGDPYVLYFYPRANTKGCTTEAREFETHRSGFTELGVSIVGVSDDSVEDLATFAASEDLSFDLLSDEFGEVATLYDSYGEKRLYGNVFDGVYRNTYVIDGAGHVAAIYEGVTPAGHAETVLEDLRADRITVETAGD